MPPHPCVPHRLGVGRRRAPRVDDVFVPTDEKECEVTGEVISLVPLGNRRTTPDGDQLVARITEAVTRDEFAGRRASA